jgi:hypothetical protein
VLLCAAHFLQLLDLSVVGVAARIEQTVVVLWRYATCAVLGQPWHARHEGHAALNRSSQRCLATSRAAGATQ